MSSPAVSSSRLAASLAVLGAVVASDAYADDFVATVVSVEGDCFSRPNVSTDPRRLRVGMQLTAADQVLCNVKSSLKYRSASKKVLPLAPRWMQIGGTPIEHDDAGSPEKISPHMQQAKLDLLQTELGQALSSPVVVARLDPTAGLKSSTWTTAWTPSAFAAAPAVPDCGDAFAWPGAQWAGKKPLYAPMDPAFKIDGMAMFKPHIKADWLTDDAVKTGVLVDKETLEKWNALTGQIKVDK